MWVSCAHRFTVDAVTCLWLCPSRARPTRLGELAGSWAETISQPAAAELRVIVDDDDPRRLEYPSLGPGMSYRFAEAGHGGLASLLNKHAVKAARPGHYAAVGFLGDDHRMRTPGWDRILDDVFGRGLAVAYGDDLHQGEKLPTAVMISSKIIAALGYMCPPGQVHLYLDDFWRTLGDALGCLTYLPHLTIEHEHPHAGKAQWDDGYQRVNDPALYETDKAAYDRFLAGQWPGDLARLKAALG